MRTNCTSSRENCSLYRNSPRQINILIRLYNNLISFSNYHFYSHIFNTQRHYNFVGMTICDLQAIQLFSCYWGNLSLLKIWVIINKGRLQHSPYASPTQFRCPNMEKIVFLVSLILFSRVSGQPGTYSDRNTVN